jgi:hypothetical protein
MLADPSVYSIRLGCTMRLPDRSSGWITPPLLVPKAEQGRLVAVHDDPSVGAAYKGTPFNVIYSLRGLF